MTKSSVLLAFALIAPLIGVGVLRLAWAGPRRSVGANAAGWALMLGGALAGGMAHGAWGVSISALMGMAAAFLVLAWAAVASPPSKARASNRRVGLIPQKGEPLRLAGRALTFVLVAVVAAIVAVGLAVTTRGVAGKAGVGAADATVLAYFVLPIVWSLIAFVLLMQESRRRQAIVLGVASLPILALGLVA
ncbi:hypothetical protein WSK_3029 [Novosphingobium sp. Rr 2-17]|uniref:hypothetical protein n=1 Tax=Novosphingobium sp. Rr 2-17 TaxID=555793 RepID=UPI000269AB81|nr:hypothetical protein [Novosphingobium sp. Rr 2-17]EIZ78410.1 hypothetical protein WSK_3029 [Novosphingobium sp. Rr 2-17]